MRATATLFAAVAGLSLAQPAAAQIYRSTTNPYAGTGNTGAGAFSSGGGNGYSRPNHSPNVLSIINGNYSVPSGSNSPYGNSRLNLSTHQRPSAYTSGSAGTYVYRPPVNPNPVGGYSVEGPKTSFGRWVAGRDNANAGNGNNLAAQIAGTTPKDIASGAALNLIVKGLEPFAAKLKSAPPTAVDAVFLRKFNFAHGTATVGLLRPEGKIEWPKLLLNLSPAEECARLRGQIEKQFADLFAQVEAGNEPDADSLKNLGKLIDQLGDMASARAQSMTFAENVEVKQHLKSLGDSVAFLRQPDAGDWLPGRTKVKAASLQDLVLLMQEKGIRFGPAFGGSEGAYTTMHRALAGLYSQVSAVER